MEKKEHILHSCGFSEKVIAQNMLHDAMVESGKVAGGSEAEALVSTIEFMGLCIAPHLSPQMRAPVKFPSSSSSVLSGNCRTFHAESDSRSTSRQ